MERRNSCLTRELACGVREAAMQAQGIPDLAATFESPALLRTVRELARVTSTGSFHLFVAVSGNDGLGQIYDLGFTDQPFTLAVVPDGSFPLARPVPSDMACLVISLEGDDPATVRVRVERFERGQRHGFTADGPAVVDVAGERLECGYALFGADTSELIANPVMSIVDIMGDTRAGARSGLSLDVRHAELARIIATAEDRGEAVWLQTPALPGLACVRMPGESSYILVDVGRLDELNADWTAKGAEHVAVRLACGPGGRECHFMRRVAGLLAGAGTGLPGACVSTLPSGGDPSDATLVISGRGSVHVDAPPGPAMPGRGAGERSAFPGA